MGTFITYTMVGNCCFFNKKSVILRGLLAMMMSQRYSKAHEQYARYET